MAGKKPYQMAPAPPVKKPSFTNTLGDAFQDVTDTAKRGLADVQDAYHAVKNKLTTGEYRQGVDVTGKEWPHARGLRAWNQDNWRSEHLRQRAIRDSAPPPPPPAPPQASPTKRAPVRAVPKTLPAKPAPRTIDPYTADRDYDSAPLPSSEDRGIKAHPPAGRPGSKKLAPSQAVRDGDIVTGRAPFIDRGVGRRVPSMGAKTDTVNATVGGKKKAVKVPKAGKVSL